jgi:hypothetical protein
MKKNKRLALKSFAFHAKNGKAIFYLLKNKNKKRKKVG